MKDKIIVIGGGGHAKAVISIVKKLDEFEILGYTDPINKGSLLGVKYLGTDDIANEIIKKLKTCKAVIGVGNISISDKRQKIYKMLKRTGFELPAIISKSAIVNKEVSIGEGTVIFEDVIINVCSSIGKCVIANTGAIVESDCKIGDFVHLTPLVRIGSGVKIGSNSFIGSGTLVNREIEIGENCLLGAGSVVIENIIRAGTYLGVPAVIR